MTQKPRVLVVCTGNSMRSQLAEGLLRADLGDKIEVFSAGTHPSSVHPLTIQALAAVGIDASKHRSKSVREFNGQSFDLVITVCDSAREACPLFPGARETIHRGYPDPVNIRPLANPTEVFAELRDRMRVELRDLVIKELDLK
jgi:arsenate reductase (thioredoxin)